ncbi:MAG: MFS transporter [Candidatus Absconditabacteria bacterium]
MTNYQNFLRIWFGQLISMIGTGLTLFSLGVYVYQLTGTTSSYVFILMCVFLPQFLLKPYGGILADSNNRLWMMIISDLGATLGILFIFGILLFGDLQLWHIYLGLGLSSLFGAFQQPAYKALATDLLTKDEYGKASGLMQLASSSQYLISPLLAGILLSIVDLNYIFAIDLVTFFTATIITITISKTLIIPKLPKIKHRNIIGEFKIGLKEFTKHKGVVNLVITTTFILFFVGMIQSLFVPMLLNITNVKNAGIIQSLCAFGILLGSGFIGVFNKTSNYNKSLIISLFIGGIFFAGIGLSTYILVIIISGIAFFATLPFINTSIEVLIRNNISNEKQGRVWAIISNVTYLGSILAFAVSGFLADKVFTPLVENRKNILGSGAGRGIGMMFVVSGIMIVIISIFIMYNQNIKNLEVQSTN